MYPVESVINIRNSRSSNSHLVDVGSIVEEARSSHPEIEFAPIIDVAERGNEPTVPILHKAVEKSRGSDGMTLVCFWGGDGLVTLTGQAIIDAMGVFDPENPGVVIAHFPLGQYNLNANVTGSPLNERALSRVIEEGEIAWVDHMRADFAKPPDHRSLTYFHSFGIGDANLIRGYEMSRKHKKGRRMKELQTLVHTLKSHTLLQARIEDLYHNPLLEGRVGFVEAGKANFGGRKLRRGYMPWDGKMAAVAIPGRSRLDFWRNVFTLFILKKERRSDGNPSVHIFEGSDGYIVDLAGETESHRDAELNDIPASRFTMQMVERSVPMMVIPPSGTIFEAAG